MPMTKAAGIFLINKDDKLLIAHPTRHKKDFWSIPKGKVENSETKIEAALRETSEEANVDLSDVNTYHELDAQTYKHKKKILYSFVILEKENPQLDLESVELKCNANVPETRGGFPEMDDWKWVYIKEAKKLLHYTQVNCLDEVQEIINKNQ